MEALLVDEKARAPPRVRVVEYTDPFSVWCWGCEPALRRLEFAYGGVEVEYRMGGLFEDFGPMREYWTRMSGGKWKEAVRTFLAAVAGQHRMPMNVDSMTAMMEDLKTTHPACVAVKAADRLGADVGRRYLRRLREAAVVEGRAIHHREVEVAVAQEAGLDVAAFSGGLGDGSAERLFREDLEECRSLGIVGFPTFVFTRGKATIHVEGFQPAEAFEDTLRALDPDLKPRPLSLTWPVVLGFLRRFGRSATREVAVAFEVTDDEAEILLEEMDARGEVQRREVGECLLWELGNP